MISNVRTQQITYGAKKSIEKGPRLSRNDEKWDSMREYIRKAYVLEGNTLPRTMQRVKEKYGFEASPRKWKMKFKDWTLEKRVTEADMKIIAAKAQKRAHQDHKETEFFHNGIVIPSSRIENFKRRKTVKDSEAASPSAETPLGITYSTPRSEYSPMRIDDVTAERDDLHDKPLVLGLVDCFSIRSGGRSASNSPAPSSGSLSHSFRSGLPSTRVSSVTFEDRATPEPLHRKDASETSSQKSIGVVQDSHRIKSLQRVYSPLLFRRVNETLHPIVRPDNRAIMLTQKKAEVHVRSHQFEKAEVLYWKVIAGWRFLGNDEKRLEAQLTLSNLFEMQYRSTDAFSLFMSTFIEYLDIALSLTLDSPQFFSFQNSIECLRRVHLYTNTDQKWAKVIDCLYNLQEAETASFLSHHEYPGPGPDFLHGPDVVKAALSLALTYSAIKEFGIAESIFKLVLNSTSESSRKRFNTLTLEDRANANRDYAMHCQQRGNHKDCFSYLARALENCSEVHFPGIRPEVSDAIKHLLKMLNRQLALDLDFAGDLAQLKLQQVSVVISIISKSVSCVVFSKGINTSKAGASHG